MSQINGNNQPWHPVEHLAFWKTGVKKLREQAAVYDELTAGMSPEQLKKFDRFISWACSERASDELYNQGDF